ncbi:hypothetical protein [Micromonospora narathiwatensis]|uniref:Uncharacterized protein n=1 Tax=Micromonospora narathiwatensis TaxID=299146 RepID=A0A1A8Z033_9ACTN|nr:hypothetical protein [Micromonospora narathiwatensis]SBT37082.1 hypothetical protein GA0070621_0025 [Micromonospora narathiwatensis]
MRDKRVLALTGLLLAAGLTATTACSDQRDADRPPAPAAAVRTAFPGLVPASGEPTLAGLSQQRPTPGTVATVPGPFDDRFDFADLALNHTTVSGSITVTSDVSAILELQVVAGLYDSSGRLLHTGRFVHHYTEDGHDHGAPEEREPFSISIPSEFLGRVASAAVGVPVLVNE